MNVNVLNEYLSTGKVAETSVAEDAAIVVALARTRPAGDEKVFKILANLCAVEMLAKDFHYRAKGKPFYGNHLLADLIVDIGKTSDDLNEIYYMGELQANPPFKCRVAEEAVRIVDAIPAMANEDGYIEAIYDRCNALVGLVEEVKKGRVLSGTTAVLDKVSQDALQIVGFMKRIMTGADMNSDTDADAPVIM